MLSHGSVAGAGPSLSFIVLEGIGEPVTSMHIRDSNECDRLCKQVCDALEALHKAGVYHRDVKPSNMIMIDDNLYLNDFDVSWATGMNRNELSRQDIGTAEFASPKSSQWRSYTADDDFASCALSFLSLLRRPIQDKQAAINLAAENTSASPSHCLKQLCKRLSKKK
jgi:serine/threonine protein kinase